MRQAWRHFIARQDSNLHPPLETHCRVSCYALVSNIAQLMRMTEVTPRDGWHQVSPRTHRKAVEETKRVSKYGTCGDQLCAAEADEPVLNITISLPESEAEYGLPVW